MIVAQEQNTIWRPTREVITLIFLVDMDSSLSRWVPFSKPGFPFWHPAGPHYTPKEPPLLSFFSFFHWHCGRLRWIMPLSLKRHEANFNKGSSRHSSGARIRVKCAEVAIHSHSFTGLARLRSRSTTMCAHASSNLPRFSSGSAFLQFRSSHAAPASAREHSRS